MANGAPLSSIPLHAASPPQIESDAGHFWQSHNLREIVSRDEFIIGSLFLVWTDSIIDLPMNPDPPSDTDSDEEGLIGLERFHRLTYQQRNSIEKYMFKKAPRRSFPLRPLPSRDVSCVIERGEPKSHWDHIRSLSRAHWTIVWMGVLAAVTQGWHQASMNGANLFWPNQLGLTEFGLNYSIGGIPLDVWRFAWVNAAPFLTGALVGSLVCDPLINERRWGRRWAIAVASIFSTVAVVGGAFSSNWKQFVAWRLLLGLGMGGKASVVPIYVSEIAPEQIRGMLVISWQLFDTLGIFIGSLANLIVFLHKEHVSTSPECHNNGDWRMMIALPFIPALMILTFLMFCVESPRWLLKQNRMRDSLKALIQLHDLDSPIIACGELYLTYRKIKSEEEDYLSRLRGPREEPTANTPPKLERINWIRRFKLIYKIPRIRNAFYASACVMIAQQACGINILIFMSSTIYDRFQGDERSCRLNLILSMIVGLVNHVCTWASFPLIDRRGRRFVLNLSFPLMAIFLFAAGGVIYAGDGTEINAALFYVMTVLFVAAFSIGEGPAAFVISAEVYPLLVRELGMSISVFFNFFFAALLTFFIPVLVIAGSRGWFWFMFGVFCLVAMVFCYCLVQDTHHSSLENIDQKYEQSKAKHIKSIVENDKEDMKEMILNIC